MTDTHRRSGSAFLGMLVILFCHTEVYKNYLLVDSAQHDVRRFDIKVVDIALVYIVQSIGRLLDVVDGFGLWQTAATFHHIAKRFSLNIFHHIVSSTIFTEYIVYLYYPWML